MERTRFLGLLAAVGVAAAGVLTGPTSLTAQAPTAAEVQPSVELPADLARVLRDYEMRWSQGDADGLAELFVEHGLIVRGGWIRGREAIRQAYGSASGPLLLRAVEYGVDGDVGYIVGAYGYGEARPADDRGLFVLTLEREPGGPWLIVSDMDRPLG